ncbi:trypsin zeta-like [Ceratitis capitata]|uniref:(Mediterranean fruit fly) hypothetical protein n=1 Tax=Ceratitis capitata TaxID=7213 RepID=A0A811VB91_CERCA|nr:trypsin zeta-like [Ceratitis capitata]CAD7012580.1 unnamed protein product [Ceratitis capitata]
MVKSAFHIVNLLWVMSLLTACHAGTNARYNFKAAHNVQGINPRIVGGQVADIAKYPHQISLRERDLNVRDEPYQHLCGGSIYSARIIITASHCVNGTEESQLVVVAGANQRAGADGVITPVQEIIMHEEYDDSDGKNDIALLVLTTALPINNFTIKPVQLTSAQPQEGEMATVTGWGLNGQHELADLLHVVTVPIVSNTICSERYGGSITDDMLCAGLLDVGGKDACQMDSGGPLLVHGKLAGVVSWGYGCAEPKFPGVYANVRYFLPWLSERITKVEAKLKEEH